MEIPQCVIQAVRQTFPSPTYVGFLPYIEMDAEDDMQ